MKMAVNAVDGMSLVRCKTRLTLRWVTRGRQVCRARALAGTTQTSALSTRGLFLASPTQWPPFLARSASTSPACYSRSPPQPPPPFETSSLYRPQQCCTLTHPVLVTSSPALRTVPCLLFLPSPCGCNGQMTDGDWTPTFAIIAVTYIVGWLFFMAWGSGEEQDFNLL